MDRVPRRPKRLFSVSQRSILLHHLSCLIVRPSHSVTRVHRYLSRSFSASQRSILLHPPLRRIPPSSRVSAHLSRPITRVLQYLSQLFNASKHPIPLQSLRRIPPSNRVNPHPS